MAIHSTRFLAGLGVAAVGLTGEIKGGILAAFLFFFLLGFGIERLPWLSRFFGAAQPFMAAAALGVALFDFFRLSQSFLLVVAHFLLALQALRLLSLNKIRDLIGSVILSSLMVLSSATLAAEWTFFLTLLVFLPASIWTVILINLAHEGNLASFSPMWKHLAPTVRFSTGMAFAVTVAFCAFIFLVFPRFSFRGFRGQFLQPVHKTGFTSQIDLNKSGRIFEDDSVVMRVVIDPRHRKMWPGYLRGAALADFDGEKWSGAELNRTQVFRRFLDPIELPGTRSAKGFVLAQHIYLETLESTVLFAASMPARINIERPFLFRGEDGSLHRRPGDTWRVHYTVESILGQNAEGAGEGFKLIRYLNLPKRLTSGFRELAEGISGRFQGELRKTQELEKYFKENYAYSLELPDATESSALEEFLFRSKRGHCEYFASAMCVMLRAVNIPSRVVTGFLTYEWNGRGNYFVVRMKDAHAWVEAYVEPHGWMRFDPSPRDIGSVGGGDSRATPFFSFFDYLNLQWNRVILSYDMERQVELVRSFNTRSREFTLRMNNWSLTWEKLFKRGARHREAGKNGGSAVVRNLTVLALGGILVSLIYALRIRWRRRSRIWFYPQLMAVLKKTGGEKPQHLTLNEFAKDLLPRFGGRVAHVRFLIDAYYQARFHPQAPIPPRHEIKRHLRAARRQLLPAVVRS